MGYLLGGGAGKVLYLDLGGSYMDVCINKSSSSFTHIALKMACKGIPWWCNG